VELLTSDKSRSLSYGFSLPTSFALVDFGRVGGFAETPFIPTGFLNFLTFGRGATLLGIGITNAGLFATATKNMAATEYDTHLVASDGMPATLHVGSKYPIVTNLFSATTSTGGQTLNEAGIPPPTIQFEDLGLSLKITPHVHGMEEMTLDVEAQSEQLGSASVNGIPELDQTKFQSSVRVRDGEWAVITGLTNQSETSSITGVAGLARVPVIGPALSTNNRSQDRGDTLIVIKPRLRSIPATETRTRGFWVGSEARPQSPF